MLVALAGLNYRDSLGCVLLRRYRRSREIYYEMEAGLVFEDDVRGGRNTIGRYVISLCMTFYLNGGYCSVEAGCLVVLDAYQVPRQH
ncbi:hypothetical protein HBI23_130340 [Parastagonospora nodorum]|nr:hypothetical protein HBI47_029850 [Parastagonospora nodorum]KAH5660381.1 hypothetical protein HBI23_130340 [Parastagonospora nodorum]